LQKLEGFAGMNTGQLLEVATKVFVSQDQEAKWEANRKMKKKMDLLAAALVEYLSWPCRAGLSRSRGNHCGWQQVLLEHPSPRKEPGRDQCAYCHQDRH
jgi:hypothetical protein